MPPNIRNAFLSLVKSSLFNDDPLRVETYENSVTISEACSTIKTIQVKNECIRTSILPRCIIRYQLKHN